MAAVWDRGANEAYLFLDGQKVGTEAQLNGSYLRDNSHTVYDIGLKRDGGQTLKGYIKDLMIIGSALNEEQLGNITGESKLFVSIYLRTYDRNTILEDPGAVSRTRTK